VLGVEIYIHAFLTSALDGSGFNSFTLRLIYHQVKIPWYPLDRRPGETQSWPGRSGEEKNSHPLPALEPPIIQPAAQRHTTELSRLLNFCAGTKVSEDFAASIFRL
jgi:hypothetical protein